MSNPPPKKAPNKIQRREAVADRLHEKNQRLRRRLVAVSSMLVDCQNEHARTRGALTASRESLAHSLQHVHRLVGELNQAQRELRAARARLARIGAPVAGGTRRTRRRRKNKKRRRTRRR